MKKKICSILLLIVMLLNSSLLTIISTAVDEIEEIVENVTTTAEEKISMELGYTQLTNKVQNELVITGILEKDTEDCALYSNPTVYFEMPEQVEKVVINSIKILYDDELELGEYAVETNEEGNQVIKVSLIGEQTQYQTDGITKGTNIRIDANIILKQDIETATTKITMSCGTAVCEKEIKVVNSSEITALSSIDELEGTKVYANGLLIETKVIRGDVLLSDNDIIYAKEIIKYDVKITNTTDNQIDNIKIVGTLADYTDYVPTKVGETSYGFVVDETVREKEIEVGSLIAGETQEYYYEVQVSDEIDTRTLYEKMTEYEYMSMVNEKIASTENFNTMTRDEQIEFVSEILREIAIEIEPDATEEEIEEAVEYMIDQMYVQHEVEEVEKDANPEYEEEVTAQIDILIDDEVINTYTIKHNIKLSEIKVIMVNKESTLIRNEWRYDIGLYRQGDSLGADDLEDMNVTLTFTLPEIFELEGIWYVPYEDEDEEEHDHDENTELEYQIDDNGLITVEITLTQTQYSLYFKTRVKNLEDSEQVTYKVDLAVTVTTDSGKSYKSNQTISEGGREAVKITQASEKNGETLETLDELTYTFTIENIGQAQESFGGYTVITFEDYIPEELTIQSVEYNNNRVQTSVVDGEIVRTITPYTTYFNSNQLIEANEQEDETQPRIKLELNIQNGETITITIKASVKLIDDEEYDKTIENYATVSGEEIKTKESNIITNRIYKETGEKEVIVTPTNPTTPTESTEPTTPSTSTETTGNTYSISGLAWIDENENGKVDSEEEAKKGLTVTIYDVNNNKFLENEKGKTITSETDKEGKYSFEDIPEGKYYIIVEYDSSEYSITEYQKSGVSELTNCDFIQKEVKLESGQKTVGITNTINLTEDKSNIDIGLIENKTFDLKIEQFIEKVTVTNSAGTKEYTYNNKKLAKVEINSKQFVGSTVVVEYKIVVTNIGELTGSVNEIIAEIPSALDFHSELNSNWSKSMTYNLSNTSYRTTEIATGESIEATLVLSITLDDKSAGTYENITKIGISENSKHIEDENSENDVDSTELIIGVSTGIEKILKIIGIIAIIIVLAIIIYVIMKKKLKISKKTAFVILMLIIIFGVNVNSYAIAEQNDSTTHAFSSTEVNYTSSLLESMHEQDIAAYIAGLDCPCQDGHDVDLVSSSSTTWQVYQDFINSDGTPKGDISISVELEITGQSTFDAIVTVNDYTGAPGSTEITVTCTGGGGSGSLSSGGGTTTIHCTGAEYILGATVSAVKTCETTYTEVTEMTSSYEWVSEAHYIDEHNPGTYEWCTYPYDQLCHCMDVKRREWVDTSYSYTDDDGNEVTVEDGYYSEWTDHSADHLVYTYEALDLGPAGTFVSTFEVEIPITYTWSDSTSFSGDSFPKKVYINKVEWDTGDILPGCVFEIDGRTVATGEQIDMLMVGTYTITEIETPHGYTHCIGNTYTLTITGTDTLLTVTAVNKKITGNTVIKIVDDITGEPKAGVVVEIIGLLEDDKHGSDGSVVYTTDENGEIRIYDLLLDEDTEERTFYVKEIYNPDYGYVVDDADYGIIVQNGEEQGAINHPEYGVVYPITVKRQESTETGKILLSVEDKDTNSVIEGLEFEVIGLMREDSSVTVDGATYTTEVVTEESQYITNDNGQIIIPDLLFDEDVIVYAKYTGEEEIIVRDVDGNIIEPIEHPEYGLVYPITIKASDPNEEQVGSEKFQENTWEIRNQLKYAQVSGSVWNDGEYAQINNVQDDTDGVLANIKVRLYDPVNNVVHVTWTDENGEYIFGVRTEKTYDFGTTPGSDDANYKDTNVLLVRASEYYIEFEYNGVKYRNVELNADPTLYDVSKASEEIASGQPDEDSTERTEFNERFTTINENGTENSNGETTGTVIDADGETYPDVISYETTGEHTSGIVYGKNMTETEGDPDAYGEEIYHITATTYKNYDFSTYYDPVRDTTGYTDEIKAVNIGLYLREQVDLAIDADLARLELNINGYSNTYKFATVATPNSDQDLQEKWEEVKNTYYERTIHESSIVYSANDGTTGANGSAYADFTYKIYLENQSTTLKAMVDEITVNYNSELVCISYNYEGETPTALEDGEEINSTIKEITLDLTKFGMKEINNQSYNVLEVTFRASAEVLANILEDEVALSAEDKELRGIKTDFMAEIKSYTTYSNNEENLQGRTEDELYVYASIDKDSAPRNATVALDEQNRYIIADNFEDDTSIAPTIVLTRGSQTSLSGTVYEDSPEDDRLDTNERVGDGIYDEDNEYAMQNVKVELLIVPADANQNYDSDDARNNTTLQQEYEVAKLYSIDSSGTNIEIGDAITYTDENGNYEFKGVIADNYVIRYTYGENISGEEGRNTVIKTSSGDVEIKAREYKSTVITSDYVRKAINTSTDGITHLNGDWLDEDDTEASWFLNNYTGTRYSDAVDDVEYRALLETNAKLNNENLNDSSKYAYSEMEAYTAYFGLGVEEFNDQNVAATLVTQEDGTTDYEYKIINIDFGLIERPIVDIEVSKSITHIKVTLANNQVIIEGDPSDPDADIPYIRTGLDGYVPIELDTELMEGATLELEYTISIANNSELDYPIFKITDDTDVANCRNYYYYGTTEGISANYTPVTVRIDVLADYLSTEMEVDLDDLRKDGWEIVEVEDLVDYQANDGNTYKLIEDKVQKELESGNYTIFITDSFADQDDLLVRIGETKEISYSTSRLLSSKDQMVYTNNLEALQYIGYSQNKNKNETDRYNRVSDTIPGNLVPGKGSEEDEKTVRVTITPPTGTTIAKTLYVVTALLGLIIVVGGLVFIKKKILN